MPDDGRHLNRSSDANATNGRTRRETLAQFDVAVLKRATSISAKLQLRWITVPVIGYCRLTAAKAGSAVTYRCTDLDIFVTCEVEARAEQEFDILLPEKTLRAFVNDAPKGSIITVSREEARGTNEITRTLALSDGETTLRFRDFMPPEDHPRFPTDMGAKVAVVSASADQVSRLIKLSRHCISTEETRYYLNGMFLTAHPASGTLRAVTTDGHRMACIDSDVPCSAAPKNIVPVGAIDLLRGMLDKESNQPVELTLFELWGKVVFGDVEVSFKCIDGTFPDYTRVIPPPSSEIGCVVNHALVSRLAKLAHSAAAFGSNAAEIAGDDGKIRLRLPNGDLIEHRIDGHGPAFGVNIRYLAAQARVTPVMKLSGACPGDPFVIVGDDPSARFIIMPMRV